MKQYVIVQTFEDSRDFKLVECWQSKAHAEGRMRELIEAENNELIENHCIPNAGDFFHIEEV